MKRLMLGIVVLSSITACQYDVEEPVAYYYLSERTYSGGDTTIFEETSDAFATPADNLVGDNLERHMTGDAHFEQNFVTGPAEVNPGLGSIFNNSACINCHPRDGRSGFPDDIFSRSGFFLRTSISGTDAHGGPNPVPGFGVQLQNQAIFGYEPEVRFSVNYTYITETLADGTEVVLTRPEYTVYDSYIPYPAEAMFSPRLAPPVFGLGLLEAIPESQILAWADENDADGDGISGKPNYVWSPATEQMELGRFGWKANNATLLTQNAGAYNEDMGVTNYVMPVESSFGQTQHYSWTNEPEIANDVLDDVTFYTQTLAVPAMRNISDSHANNGAKIFDRLDCAKCHIPKTTSGTHEVSEISNQTFWAYTDMLLHDMGEGLADGRPDFLANGSEWKTRPLWGIGMTNLVNGHTNFLHDGRAKNITEAILWHGGEAENAKEQFKELSTSDREDLLKFLNSL